MPVPKRKTSKRKIATRASGKGFDKNFSTSDCSNCKLSKPGHSICEGCGFYNGVKVLKTKLDRAKERMVKRTAKNQAIMKTKGTSTPEEPSSQE